MAIPSSLAGTIAHQIAMNKETWAALQAHGVDENTELRPGETEAKAPADFLPAGAQTGCTFDGWGTRVP